MSVKHLYEPLARLRYLVPHKDRIPSDQHNAKVDCCDALAFELNSISKAIGFESTLLDILNEKAGSMWYVAPKTPVFAEDHNIIVEFLKYAVDTARHAYDYWASATGRSSDKVEAALAELEAKVTKLRYYKTMDIWKAEDHNLLVDMFYKHLDYLNAFREMMPWKGDVDLSETQEAEQTSFISVSRSDTPVYVETTITT